MGRQIFTVDITFKSTICWYTIWSQSQLKVCILGTWERLELLLMKGKLNLIIMHNVTESYR